MIAWVAACTADRGEVVVRVPIERPEDLALLEELGGDLWTEHVVDTADVRLTREALRRLPFAHEVLIADVGAAIDASFARGAIRGFYDDWHPLDEVLDQLDVLDAEWGVETRLLELGTSHEGRPIRGLRIRSGPLDDRPGILVTGAQHAREWVAASSALWVAEHLVRGMGTDPEVDDLLARYRVTVVPVVNPDGYEHTWTTDRLWRKNRRDNGDGTFGVDLNRNWDAVFGGAGSSGRTSSDNYRGPEAFSEPETDAVRAFVDGHPRYGLHLDLHCTGQLVLSPWGFTPTPSPDAALIDGAGVDAAATITAVHGSEYDAGPMNTRLYPASGIAIDWTYGVHGLNSWLLELRDRGGQYGFLLPADQIEPTAEEVWAGLLHLADAPQARLGLRLLADPIGGSVLPVDVHRSRRDAAVELWWSTTGPGTTVLADGIVLELDAAELLATDTAGVRGSASFEVDVPADRVGETAWFQASDGTVRSIPVSAPIQ